MSRWPIIRHIRCLYLTWRVYRFAQDGSVACRKCLADKSAWEASQSAPTESEPDFVILAKDFMNGGDCGATDTTERVRRGMSRFGERMYRLGLIAWPKVEDALIKELNGVIKFHNERAEAAEAKLAELQEADVQRVKDIARLTIERDEAREKLAEREAKLAKADEVIELCRFHFASQPEHASGLKAREAVTPWDAARQRNDNTRS